MRVPRVSRLSSAAPAGADVQAWRSIVPRIARGVARVRDPPRSACITAPVLTWSLRNTFSDEVDELRHHFLIPLLGQCPVITYVHTMVKGGPRARAGGPAARANLPHKCACCTRERPYHPSVCPGTDSAQGTSRVHRRHGSTLAARRRARRAAGASQNLRARRTQTGVKEVWMRREVAEARVKAVVE